MPSLVDSDAPRDYSVSCITDVGGVITSQLYRFKGLVMAFEMIQCPHCHTRVLPLADGNCPACRKNPQQEPAPEAVKESTPASGEAWDRYQESLRPSPSPITESIIGEQESLGTPAPARHVEDFQQALKAFTPRLIATPAIMWANLMVFAAMIYAGVDCFQPAVPSMLAWGANHGPLTENGQWWRLVTCMFLHFGILHLGFNMWILWDLGRVVERFVGNFGFVVVYFVSGIAGSIASLFWNPFVVSAGASGAVFGVAGTLLGLITFRQDTIPAPVLKHLRNSMLTLLFYNLVYGMIATGIDMAAHIGGLVAGYLCGLFLSQPLSVAMVARRPFRNATVATVGALILLLSTFALPNPLPLCTSPVVVKLLERLLRGTPAGATLKSIDSYRELSFDRDANIRHGECIVHTSSGDIPVKFVVEWQDRNTGKFQVRTLGTDLPSCTSAEVMQLLEQIVQKSLDVGTFKSVDSARELSFDRDANVRHGECVVHTSTGDIPVKFLVEWTDQEKGQFQVRTVPTDLPSCASADVKKLLEQLIRNSLKDFNLESVDSHRERSFDHVANVRHGECVAHVEMEDIPIYFIVEWQDREKAQFQVRLVEKPD